MYRADTLYTMDSMRESITTLVAERDAGILAEDAFCTLITSSAVSAAVFGDDELSETVSAIFTDDILEDGVAGRYTDAVMAAIDSFVAAMTAAT